jgi:predicted ABC-type ATPase
MAKTLYLIAGANGSGKTTLAHELLKDEPGLVFLNADEIAEKISDPTGISAGRILLANIDKIMDEKKSFTMESTISGNHHLRVLEKAIAAKYEIILIYVFLENPDLNVARVQKRVHLGGHNVPEDVIRRRCIKSVQNFAPTAKFAKSWKLYYNNDVNYELIARSENGVIEIQNNEKFKAFNEVAKI